MEYICDHCKKQVNCKMQPSRNVVFDCGMYERRKIPTNADRIRSMSDEELAEYIHGVSEATKPCVRCGEDCDFCELPTEECKRRVLKWLQEECKDL